MGTDTNHCQPLDTCGTKTKKSSCLNGALTLDTLWLICLHGKSKQELFYSVNITGQLAHSISRWLSFIHITRDKPMCLLHSRRHGCMQRDKSGCWKCR